MAVDYNDKDFLNKQIRFSFLTSVLSSQGWMSSLSHFEHYVESNGHIIRELNRLTGSKIREYFVSLSKICYLNDVLTFLVETHGERNHTCSKICGNETVEMLEALIDSGMYVTRDGFEKAYKDHNEGELSFILSFHLYGEESNIEEVFHGRIPAPMDFKAYDNFLSVRMRYNLDTRLQV